MSSQVVLRYSFKPGEIQVHRQTITLVLEQPDGSKAGGRVVCDLTQKVLTIQGERFQIEFEQKVVSREGALGEQVPLQLAEGRSRCWMDARGALLEHMESQLSPTPPLPEEAVAPGQLWSVVQATPAGGPLELQFQLEKLESGVAHLVSHARPAPGATGEQSEIRGSLQFRLDPGGPLRSTTVLLSHFPDGRKVHQVVQLERLS